MAKSATNKKQVISIDKWQELSNLVLDRCRAIDDMLYPKGGWQGWSTGGMRMMTNTILEELLERLNIEVDRGF